jgi:Ser/Thr protein kinase RdoA (MazF antagonist)
MTPAPPLGRDLSALVRARPSPLARCARISTHGAARGRRETFRLDFADGTTLKGRRLPSPADARRIATIVRRLDPARFPPVVARRGAALLETWVPGDPLDRLPAAAAHLAWAGETLGALHRVPVARRPAAARWMRERRAACARELDDLVRMGALAADAARRLRDAAFAAAPAEAGIAIVHRDLCPENIVVDAQGRLHSVDNAGARVGAADEDLARTCTRWPLGPGERALFLDAYRAFRDPAPFLAHLPFWTIAALAHATWIRRTRRYARADLPLTRLLAQLDDACSTSPTARS